MITKKCRDCGKEFTLTDKEIGFYKSKGLNLPNRCEECRKKRKNSQNQSSSDNTLSKSEKSPEAVGLKQTKKSPYSAVWLIAVVLIIVISVILPNVTNDETENVTSSEITTAEETGSSITSSEIKDTEEVENIKYSDTENIDETEITNESDATDNDERTYYFRNEELLNQHFEKHGKEMGFSTAYEYEAAASEVVNNSNALHKIEQEDGDDVYYLESTNDFVIVSTDGYIRTYFRPDKGKDYFDRQ